MKNTLLISVVVLFLASCSNISFENSMPQNTESFNTFPKELIGTYFDGQKDTLKIYETCFVYGKLDRSILYMNDTLKKGFVELKHFNNYYMLNKYNAKTKIWQIIPFTFNNGEIEVYSANLDKQKEQLRASGDTTANISTIIEQIEKITPVKIIDKPGENEIKDYIINPTNKELEELFEQGYFMKTIIFKKIKNK